MQKVFTNGAKNDNRDILIIIHDEAIEFFFYEQYKKHIEWLAEQEENGEYIEDEAKENNGFYWFDKNAWVRDKTQRLDQPDNWHTHMAEKRWFTTDMAKFINDNTPPHQ